jgi:hypothetical protein
MKSVDLAAGCLALHEGEPYHLAHPEVWPALETLINPNTRSAIAAALVEQEHLRVIRRTVRAARHPHQPQHGGRIAARTRLQLADGA